MVGKPEIVVREENGKKLEPLERLVVDCPEKFIGIVMELARHAPRRTGKNGESRFRAGAHGVHDSLARLDRTARPVAHRHARHCAASIRFSKAGPNTAAKWRRVRRARSWPIAQEYLSLTRSGELQERGEMFVGPGNEVYEGMIVGENARDDDMDVNVTKEKKQTNMRASSADEAIRLIPPRQLTPRTSHRVHRRRRVRRGHAEIHPPAQENSRHQEAPQALAGNQSERRSRFLR